MSCDPQSCLQCCVIHAACTWQPFLWHHQLKARGVSCLAAEAISETIKSNCLEMKSYSADIKKLVSPVAMRTTSQQNGNGNGNGKESADDHSFATPDISSTPH